MSNALAVKTADFEKEVLQSEVPVLVDFWAPWCPPCRAIAPTLDIVASEMEGKARIVKVDVDDEPEVAARYGVSSIPALLLFKGGEQVGQLVGAHPKSTITTPHYQSALEQTQKRPHPAASCHPLLNKERVGTKFRGEVFYSLNSRSRLSLIKGHLPR